MRKGKASFLLILGMALVAVSFCALLFFGLRSHLGMKKGQRVVSQLEQLLPEREPGIPGIYSDPAMPALEIEGEDYVGILEVPAFGITLPVADIWDSGKLYAAPRRFFGSVYEAPLVIGGADAKGQFAFCGQIDPGAVITFTDMTGAEFTYVVTRVDRASHAGAQWLTKDSFPLTLFCADSGSMEYLAVRCVLSVT